MPFVIDTFTEPSDVDITSHTPERGGPWVLHPVYAAGLTVDAATDRIFSNATPNANYATADPPSADYYVTADFYLHSAEVQNMGVCARMDTSANTMYSARLDSGTIWQIRKILAGVQSTLGSSTNQIPTASTFKRGKLVVQGSQLFFYVNDVLEIGPVTDTVDIITAVGKAGIRNSGLISATTGIHLDNFEAGPLSSPRPRSSLRPAIFKPGLAR